MAYYIWWGLKVCKRFRISLFLHKLPKNWPKVDNNGSGSFYCVKKSSSLYKSKASTNHYEIWVLFYYHIYISNYRFGHNYVSVICIVVIQNVFFCCCLTYYSLLQYFLLCVVLHGMDADMNTNTDGTGDTEWLHSEQKKGSNQARQNEEFVPKSGPTFVTWMWFGYEQSDMN